MDALVQGEFGTAELLEVPALPQAAETVCQWLIKSPHYHPFWDTYTLNVVRLTDDLPGFPEPHHEFEGTTHELLIVALNPEKGPYDKDKLVGYYDTGALPYLTPVNVCEQFIATDDEMIELAFLGVVSICNGVMSPEPPLDSHSHSKNWLAAMTKTLAHIRGEEHAP